jgi:hypothetical protein
MRSLPVAHFEIQDVWVAVIFLDGEFAAMSGERQQKDHEALRECAMRAGLRGSVVTMWKDAAGRKQFISEPAQRPFFESVRYDQLYAQRNRWIECENGRG